MDNSELLVVTGILAIGALLFSSVANLAGELSRNRYAFNLGHWLQIRLIREIASRPYGYFLQHSPATFHKRVISDVTWYVSYVLLPLLDSLARLFSIILLTATLFLVSPTIALGALALLGGFYLCVFVLLGPRRALVSEGLRQANGNANIESLKFFEGIKPIKVHSAENYFLGRYARHSAKQAKYNALVPVYGTTPRHLIEPVAFGGVVLFVVIMAARGSDLTVLIPSLGVIAVAGYRLLPAVQMLYSQLNQVNSMRHALDEVYMEFVRAEGEPKTSVVQNKVPECGPFSWQKQIELRDVSYAYSGASSATLTSLNLTIQKGSPVAIMGESGSGKSTLVDLMLGLHHPSSGKIYVDGVALEQNDMKRWLSGVGYVPQDIFLIDDTISCNIAFGVGENEINHDRVKEVCEMAQIGEFIERDLPNGFSTRIGDRGVRLSGGQRQRLGIARALYHRPSLLILDEATSALDMDTERRVVQAIEMLRGEIAMLVITHRLSTVQNFENIYILEDGELRNRSGG
ncbi:MAG: ABC transporter ATP-binding protein [Pseudomonadales bacterium]